MGILKSPETLEEWSTCTA